ncbi:uncharacterized protein LOC131612999 isoform X3 [Vicia villosa]|uniref:uncharacterized protein LOC131612999 isoform X3 n=1 Tax=Vicia villosa TaxID=3911 RepID=UPI00273CC53C|nr:uncharacterized protein LOC131612999 isoform X3 [Vicia villosa]
MHLLGEKREILQSTVDLVQNNLNLEVIYGDTDSIMIYSGLDDIAKATSIAKKVIQELDLLWCQSGSGQLWWLNVKLLVIPPIIIRAEFKKWALNCYNIMLCFNFFKHKKFLPEYNLFQFL